MAISSNALPKLLQQLGQPQTPSANMTKQKMAVAIAGAVTSHYNWLTADVTNVRLAASCQDSAEASSLAFCLELVT